VSEETRKNLIALLIAFGVVALVLAFALRPGVVLPTSETALANSIAGELGSSLSSGGRRECVATEGLYECRAAARGYPLADPDPSHRGGSFRVEVGWDGCWGAYRGLDPPGQSSPAISGCISILDY
jgi:hypothetical protein